MAARSVIPRLTDIIEAIERIHAVLGDMPLDVFETDWQRQWLVERGVEIISEASRHLTDELKAASRNALAESGGHRQRAAPQLRKRSRACHMEAGASRFGLWKKSAESQSVAPPLTAELINPGSPVV